MGILRLYLALCVVAEHGGGQVLPWRMHGGRQAVEIFYMISGFYMALVLSTRYSNPRAFYVSRLLRIFPPYWIILLGTFILSITAGLLFHHWMVLSAFIDQPFNHNGTAGIFLAAFSNITLIGQDWIMFLKHDAGQSLQFTKNFWNDPSPLFHYLLIPQSWTIGVELVFYATAPYLNRLASAWLGLAAVCSFVARLIAYRCLGLAHDPWTYRFFPFELGLFLCGMLAYRLYAQMSVRRFVWRWQPECWYSYALGAIALLAALNVDVRVIQYLGRHAGPDVAALMTYPLFILGIPVLFLVFGKNGFDRLVGEMSYPIYLLHLTIIIVLTDLPGIGQGAKLARVASLLSIIFAAFFYRLFIARLDTKRHELSAKSRESQIDQDGVELECNA